ncbi:MAG: AAC(3) family N-acetyltransferase [Candidatus Thermoplasmatota archaeon]|nr:AAC(3) family N-acetyltransferase [Candidatus Thermoplasmatota archaeon]
MNEEDVVRATQGMPATVQSIRDDLAALGIAPGMVLLVHSSLSSLGWVCGGPVAVVMALEAALGREGTLVMPAYSDDLSEPSYWKNPPVPETWWATIRQTMPPYDVSMTPTRGVGAIPECFRNQVGTRRSLHPSDSFAARGPHAETIVGEHTLDFPMGDGSPLARIYDLDGWILLLGANFQCATSLHLAEYRAKYPKKKQVKRGAPAVLEGMREWVEYQDFDWDDSDFTAIGTSFVEKTGLVRSGRVANGKALLIPQRPFIDYAVEWMEKNRR